MTNYGSIEAGQAAPVSTGNRKTVIAVLVAAAVGLCALAAVAVHAQQAPTELMALRLPNGRIVEAIPVQSLFGPGDLPQPIEDDGLPGGDAKVVPGSNVHLFEHFAPPQPYGMDNRRDPPYDTSFQGMGFGSDGR
eukprot:CAMPEP_0181344392 /NCGR_PEP_ID=MMETSP1101-20121128/32149_1 /TAXON_ID=46948 /ORGANISM="Rhodomonas abbreviata, Strain Caron Lab Isolate" /LENGTH=134 /DNA_ID=CAMNT_0023456193 /DNA_START=579 /DNA_END=983 /DNA_ORIENTATION=+